MEQEGAAICRRHASNFPSLHPAVDRMTEKGQLLLDFFIRTTIIGLAPPSIKLHSLLLPVTTGVAKSTRTEIL